MAAEPASGLQDQDGGGDLARMIALHGYDPSFVEDDYFRSFVRKLNPEFEVPSRVAIENMCDGIFDEARRELLDRLRRAPGKVNLAVGRAETMEEQVVYVACHFIDDGWNLHKLLLDAFVTTDLHDIYDGPILGLDVHRLDQSLGVRHVVSGHGIADDRLFIVAFDPAVKDDVFGALTTWTRCSTPLPDAFCKKEITSTTYVDKVLHSVARCLLPNSEAIADLMFGLLGEKTDLLLTRQGRQELLAELDLDYGWAYDEHWYACYCSLQVLYKKAFPGQLADEDLDMINLLCKPWQKIYHAIKKISSPTGPTANLCLAELFKPRKVLQLELTQVSSKDHEAINLFYDGKDFTCVLREAIDALDKAIKDSHLAFSLPLALDPRYKLEFIRFNFERAYGSETATEYISKVTTMIRDLYADYVKDYGTTDGADRADGASAMDITTSADDPLEQDWNEYCHSQQHMATEGSSRYHPEAETDLDRYLKDPRASQEGFDILNWWKDHSSKYPMVARMARDALAMPTCSKLSSNQMAQVRSILRAYSKKPYGAEPKEFMSI